MQRLSLQQITSIHGKPVYSSGGEKIGNVEAVFYDADTGTPEWLGVSSGFLHMQHSLVPAQGARLQEESGGLEVPFTKDQVKGAPGVGVTSDEISEETGQRLYAHYGLEPLMQPSETQLPEAHAVEGSVAEQTHVPGEASTVRREEELRTGKREVERGRVRLRKWVETEPANADVEVRRQTAHVEREQIDRPAPGAQIGEEQAEMTLHEEEPVVGKETVEKERVTVEPHEETHRETVEDEVRKERVEVEGDVEEQDQERWRKAG